MILDKYLLLAGHEREDPSPVRPTLSWKKETVEHEKRRRKEVKYSNTRCFSWLAKHCIPQEHVALLRILSTVSLLLLAAVCSFITDRHTPRRVTKCAMFTFPVSATVAGLLCANFMFAALVDTRARLNGGAKFAANCMLHETLSAIDLGLVASITADAICVYTAAICILLTSAQLLFFAQKVKDFVFRNQGPAHCVLGWCGMIWVIVGLLLGGYNQSTNGDKYHGVISLVAVCTLYCGVIVTVILLAVSEWKARLTRDPMPLLNLTAFAVWAVLANWWYENTYDRLKCSTFFIALMTLSFSSFIQCAAESEYAGEPSFKFSYLPLCIIVIGVVNSIVEVVKNSAFIMGAIILQFTVLASQTALSYQRLVKANELWKKLDETIGDD